MSRTSPVTATANPMLDALEQIWAVCLDNKSDRCNHKMALDFVRQIAGKAVSTANSDGHAQCSKEPAAYLHTLHMELGQTQRKLMWTEPSPFGIPGKHYDATYTVSCTPLFALTDTSTDQPARGASSSGGCSHNPADSSPERGAK